MVKHISILIPNGQFSIVNVAGTLQILEAANEMSLRQSGKRLFDVELVAAQNPARDNRKLYLIYPSKTIEEIVKTDLIIVPAVHADIDAVIRGNEQVIQWIRTQHKGGTEIASLCVGIYLLAAAGVLKGRVCTTHWAHVPKLKNRFPDLTIREENFIVEDNGIYTSGGAYGFTNLILYLIEKFSDREIATQLSKAFMIDIDKGSQSTFKVFAGDSVHADEMVLKVQQFIEKSLGTKFTVDELAESHATIRRTLERRFRRATGNSINEYTQKVRVEAAKRQLEQGRKTVSEIMYNVGYNDSKSFREIFKRYAGVSPLAYREKFGAGGITLKRV